MRRLSPLLVGWLVLMRRFAETELVIDWSVPDGRVVLRQAWLPPASAWAHEEAGPGVAAGAPRRRFLREEQDHVLAPPREEVEP